LDLKCDASLGFLDLAFHKKWIGHLFAKYLRKFPGLQVYLVWKGKVWRQLKGKGRDMTEKE
jgi:hypothetical protein